MGMESAHIPLFNTASERCFGLGTRQREGRRAPVKQRRIREADIFGSGWRASEIENGQILHTIEFEEGGPRHVGLFAGQRAKA